MYARGRKKIDHVLGDQHVREAVIKSGALGLHDGVSFSDHTLQFLDFDIQWLFNSESTPPISRYEREFPIRHCVKSTVPR